MIMTMTRTTRRMTSRMTRKTTLIRPLSRYDDSKEESPGPASQTKNLSMPETTFLLFRDLFSSLDPLFTRDLNSPARRRELRRAISSTRIQTASWKRESLKKKMKKNTTRTLG